MAARPPSRPPGGRAGDELTVREAFDQSVAKGAEGGAQRKPSVEVGHQIGGFGPWSNVDGTPPAGGFSFFGTIEARKSDASATGIAKDYKPIGLSESRTAVLSFDKPLRASSCRRPTTTRASRRT
jgi:hypothetical protein